MMIILQSFFSSPQKKAHESFFSTPISFLVLKEHKYIHVHIHSFFFFPSESFLLSILIHASYSLCIDFKMQNSYTAYIILISLFSCPTYAPEEP